MFGVGISVVRLIDENRQWFKSMAEDSNLPQDADSEKGQFSP